MRNYSKLLRFTWAFNILLCLSNYTGATGIRPIHPFIVKLEPFSSLSTEYVSKISLTISNKSEWHCNEVPVLIEGTNGLKIISQNNLLADLTIDSVFSTIIEILIPSNDTFALSVTLKCGEFPDKYTRFLVSTGDTVDFFYGSPRSFRPKPKPPDTTKYEIKIDLRDSTRLNFFIEYESYFSPLIPAKEEGFFYIKVTKETMRELRMEKFKFELMEDVPGFQVPPQQDSIKQKSKSDSIKQQGALDESDKLIYPDGFSLEYVDGMTTPGQLPVNQTITFHQ